MASFKNDLQFGLKNELVVLPIIIKFFDDEIEHTINEKFKSYDFQGLKNNYELKSRTNKHNAFNETLLGYNKKPTTDKSHIFLFKFTDGLFYIKYDETIFENFEIKPFQRNKRIDYYDKKDLYYYIPYEKLTKIEVN